jgi:predicted Zn-dependent peptidase
MPLKHTVEEIHLKNGAKGLFIYAPDTTSIHYDVHFRAGNHYARRREIQQVAHVMEHMAFGANSEYADMDEFSQELSKNGGYSNAFTGTIEMVYEVDAPIIDWNRILTLEELSITKPVYTEEQLQAEKGNVREEILGYHNNYGRIVWQEVYRAVGLQRWYDPEELKAINAVTLEDITEHHKRTHTTKNMQFIFAGDLQPHRDEIIEQLEKWSIPEGELLAAPKDELKAAPLTYVERDGLSNLTFQLSLFINEKLTEEERYAMGILRHIITGTFHSRIFGAARRKGWCYGMDSWVDDSVTGAWVWGVDGQVSAENAQSLFELIATEVARIAKEGVTDKELEGAKSYRLGDLQMGTDTVRSLVRWYSDEYYDYSEINIVEDTFTHVNAVTSAQIQETLQKFLCSDIWTLGIVGKVSEQERNQYQAAFQKVLKIK